MINKFKNNKFDIRGNMKKLISIFLITLFIFSLTSCQLISALTNSYNQIILSINHYSDDSFRSYTLNNIDSGNKISSFTLNDNLILSYIDITDGTIKFLVKETDEANLFNERSFYGVKNLVDNEDYEIPTNFNFNINVHPKSYLTIFDKIDFNIFSFYYLNSDYCLAKKELKIVKSFNNDYSLTIYRFEELSTISNNNQFENLPESYNAILYYLNKSQKIAYVTFYNNLYYIVGWDKNLLNYSLINFTGESNYNFSDYDNSNIIEYNYNKIYVASTNQYYIDSNYYLIIYKVDFSDNSYEKIYNSKDEGKIANNIPIKMLYIEENGKLYIAWSYKENAKDYLVISEYNFQSKRLLDKIKIDITGNILADLDLKRISVNGIKSSNLKIAYCLTNSSLNNNLFYGIIKTDNFSVSNWSIAIGNEFIYENIYYLSISNSPYFFTTVSKYNSSNKIQYGLFLIH